jgi:hypothetical protein
VRCIIYKYLEHDTGIVIKKYGKLTDVLQQLATFANWDTESHDSAVFYLTVDGIQIIFGCSK